MRAVDCCVLAGIAALLLLAIVVWLRRRRRSKGCSGCCAGCAGGCAAAVRQPQDRERRGVVIAGFLQGKIKEAINIRPTDVLICADRGADYAAAEDITPHYVIGDFDSLQGELPEGAEIIRLPAEKDETDTYMCIEKAVELGCGEVVIVGGIGGQLDHTLANIQTLARFADRGVRISLKDSETSVFLLDRGSITLKEDGRMLSIFSYSERAVVSESGVKYPLHHKQLTNAYPLGVSNEIREKATITCHRGRVLILLTRRDG